MVEESPNPTFEPEEAKALSEAFNKLFQASLIGLIGTVSLAILLIIYFGIAFLI